MFGKLFQLGYVVGDLDAAMARLGEAQGIREFQLQIRDKPDTPIARSAKAYIGSVMVELLEPRTGFAPAMYTDYLDQHPGALRLQHLGYLVESEEEFAAVGEWMKARNIAPIHSGGIPGVVRATYFDTRSSFGHYTEYILLLGAKDFYQDVPVTRP